VRVTSTAATAQARHHAVPQKLSSSKSSNMLHRKQFASNQSMASQKGSENEENIDVRILKRDGFT
jgi:hypothetical protein